MREKRSFGLAVRVSAFISALLLSLLCGLFYNAWKYEAERIEAEEGGWHSRIAGDFSEEDLEAIKNFANVEDAVRNEKGYGGTEPAADIYFSDKGAVLKDTPHIAELLGVPQERIVYNGALLAMYLIRAPGDTAPRLLFPLFLLITLAASFSLIVIIHNSFALSMNARIHQLGILSSVGASPGQIRIYLLWEAAVLCAGPVIAGNLLGIAGSAVLVRLTNVFPGNSVPGRHQAVFGYHPLVLALTFFATFLTVWISARLPARRLSRLTPLEAIKNVGELQLKRKKASPLLSRLFGVEGELAGNALRAQRKALRTAALSFLFSFLAFALMQCVFTLSRISTGETYFERYQDVWDIMAAVRETGIEDFKETAAVRELEGVENAIAYQKAVAKRIVAEAEMSEELRSLGGFSQASGDSAVQTDGGWLVNAPIAILDDQSFSAYCEQIGVPPRLDGAVVLNRIRDVTDPDFRHPVFLPYLKAPDAGGNAVSVLRQYGNETMTAEIPVLAYTQEVPPLREEYATLDHYELVHFLPASLWKEIKNRIGGAEEDSYLCVKAREGVTSEELTALQGEIGRLCDGKYTLEQENRIQEYEMNDRQIRGMMTVFGAFCALLAVIGIGNVFSNTLGFVHQRRREFARYMSVGMTPGEMRKLFCAEALVTAVRPVLLSLPVVIAAVWGMLRASYMEADVFLAEAPFLPILWFMLAIAGSVACAYFLAWRNVRTISLAEVLRDDSML